MRMTIWRMIAWEKIIPSVHQKRIGGRIANEILMFFRSGKKSAQDVSLSDPIDTDKDGNALTILDTMAVDDTIVESIDLKMKSQRLYRYLQSVLTLREREVVCRRYGLLGFSPQPQRMVAKRLGISRSYVSRIEKKAISKLKLAFREAGVSD